MQPSHDSNNPSNTQRTLWENKDSRYILESNTYTGSSTSPVTRVYSRSQTRKKSNFEVVLLLQLNCLLINSFFQNSIYS